MREIKKWFGCLVATSLLTACGGSQATSGSEHPGSDKNLAASNAGSDSSKTSEATQASKSAAFTALVAVMPVKDHAASVAWYSKWLGRGPDVVPSEGVAEWNLADAGWLQVGLDPEKAGQTSVVLMVPDVVTQRQACSDAGLAPGEIQDYGVVKLVSLVDPDGNQVTFVQQVSST